MSTLTRTSRREPVALPHRWDWLIRGFRRYCTRYVRKHMHAVRLSRSSAALPITDEPILVVLNHSSWWDPLIGIVLSNRLALPLAASRLGLELQSRSRERLDQFAAIDAVAVNRYAFFKHLGFIGVDRRSLRGAADFLRIGQAILSEPNRAFWVTAQGRFTDVRERPLNLRSGVGHLAARLERGLVLPLAIEYSFWNERSPEALARFGEPISIAEHPGLDGKQWTQLIEDALTETLDILNAEAMSRNPAKFTTLIEGRAGVGGVYDWWRRLKAWLRGERFDPSHDAAMKVRP